ncbi:ADP-heptose:LPS heptosyltransferase [Elusimicrobium posterum]|uniref:glycosyltransferase family 9 protein n=1 Tax=Elusimicrobium posterum TaxID=3116653 RepID=UPI003C722C56
MQKKFLLIRTDRIGDAISILPAVSILRKNFPSAHIAVFCAEYTADIFRTHHDIDEVIVKTNFKDNLREIKARKFDVAIHFFLNAYVAWLTFLARIPVRIGPVSKIWAILLNKRIKQQRSKVLKHEADFNNELLKPLFVYYHPAVPKIYVLKKDDLKAKNYLEEKFSIGKKDILIMLHPGSKGSAKNWSADNYAALAGRIMSVYPSVKVMVTGGPAEQQLLEYILTKTAPYTPFILTESLKLSAFIALINQCKIFISNSTGPLHIATALGKRTVSFYPNIKGCLPQRWGPYGKGHIVLKPEEGEPKLMKDCSDEHMDGITVDMAFEAFEKQFKMLDRLS